MLNRSTTPSASGSDASRPREIRKLLRFVRLYGPRRALFKAAGRMRAGSLRRLLGIGRSSVRDIAMVGCGQFAFATIGFFIGARFGRRFATCYDVSAEAAESFASLLGAGSRAHTPSAAISSEDVRFVFVASNHASHTPYAVEALSAGKTVYLEKPVSVSWKQLSELAEAVRASKGRIHSGYNRPHAAGIRRLRGWCTESELPLTMSCFISGHVLSADHWYREPQEGTRICGNVGHWLDLAVHMLLWGALPDRWKVLLAWSNDQCRDEELSISLVSARGDLINIVMTARSEPYEGINESINVQWGETIAKIDDFRRLTVWKNERVKSYRFWPKDVGHERAVLQPFAASELRDWGEVELSTMLMLHIAEMVVEGRAMSEFSFSERWAELGVSQASPPLAEKLWHP